MNRRDFLATPALAPTLVQGQTEEGFTSLFDGQTLRGWSVQEGPESAFHVNDGHIVGHLASDFPAWLRFDKQYENFDFRCEFFVKGWTDGGIYFHAPEHGRNTWIGMQIKIFHQQDKEPRSNSMGAIFPLVAPSKVNVRNKGEWNDLRILMDWPQLRVWVNGEVVQDLDAESVPELRYRLRRGYLGLSTLSYPIRFRNLRIRELPGKEKWEHLYETDQDFQKWFVSESNPRNPVRFEPLNGILRGDGLGHIAIKEKYRDFQLHVYIRAAKSHNGGVLFRTDGKGLASSRHYEIQLHDVEEAHFPTGSLYYFKRSIYPRIEPEKWYLMQLIVKGKNCLVRINGENVLDYDQLENLDEGHIELQAHQAGCWTEFKHIWIKRL
jgi:hypothetical protein